MIVKRGDYGPHVVELQKALKKEGFWPSYINFSKRFGPTTDKYLRKFQAAKDIVVDGKAGKESFRLLNITIEVPQTTIYDEKYKEVTIEGSHFPDAAIRNNLKIRFNKEMLEEYIPARKACLGNESKGLSLLVTIMAYKEGFRKGTRSYRTNNPGNIGNTDSGLNKQIGNLQEGILAQRNYVRKIVNGKHKAYPLGERKIINPYFSPEIAKHSKLYGMSPYLPGYNFVFTGQLDQFVKIYATGARAGNSYLSMIISYFKKNGVTITPQTTLQEILEIK
jgi:peptidoglycan hydrolase-like protein with peptidoglycan-binding domain